MAEQVNMAVRTHDLIVKLGLWNKRKAVYDLLSALASQEPQ